MAANLISGVDINCDKVKVAFARVSAFSAKVCDKVCSTVDPHDSKFIFRILVVFCHASHAC
jgi:hypothetical protein